MILGRVAAPPLTNQSYKLGVLSNKIICASTLYTYKIQFYFHFYLYSLVTKPHIYYNSQRSNYVAGGSLNCKSIPTSFEATFRGSTTGPYRLRIG